jgi:ATP-dependent DNA helicase DinG
MTMTRSEIQEQVLFMLRYLSDEDPDMAAERNDVGFNSTDANFGHSLANQNYLSDKQIDAALRMLGKYGPRQLGPAGYDHPAVVEAWKAAPRRQPSPPQDSSGAGVVPVPSPLHEENSALARPGDDDSFQPRIRELLGPDGPIAKSLPGYEPREPQLLMAEAVERAFHTGENVAVEAGTGTGKSLSYLIPAIASGTKTIVSTADKSLQEQIAKKDVPFLQEHLGIPFRAAVLKGRANYVCRNAVAELTQSEEADTQAGLGGEFALIRTREAAEALPDFLTWLQDCSQDAGFLADIETYPGGLEPALRDAVTVSTDECLGRKCPFYATCFAEEARAKAKRADIIIVNHALLLRDLEVRHITDGYASALPDADAIVIDECHNLEPIATDAFDDEVNLGRWRRISQSIGRILKGNEIGAKRQAREGETILAAATSGDELYLMVARRIEEGLRYYLDDLVGRMGSQTTLRLGDERPLVRDILGSLDELATMMEDSGPAHLDEKGEEQWTKVTKRVANFATALESMTAPGNLDVVRYAEKPGGDGPVTGFAVKLHCKPINVADPLRERLWNVRLRHNLQAPGAWQDEPDAWDDEPEGDTVQSPRPHVLVIATSATIAVAGNVHNWRADVGMDHAHELVVQSPFDYRHQALLYIPEDVDRYNPKGTHIQSTESVAYYDHLADELDRLVTAAEGRSFLLFTSFRSLNEVYERLVGRYHQKHLVLRQGEAPRKELVDRFKADGHAVLFGVKSFWEGVDVQGEALSLVAIDKIPFTPPGDPVFQAREERLKARGGNAFGDLMLPYAIIALKQGFGRLIRTRSDRGVVALMDTRIRSSRYGTTILHSLPPATLTGSLDAVKAFYGQR